MSDSSDSFRSDQDREAVVASRWQISSAITTGLTSQAQPLGPFHDR